MLMRPSVLAIFDTLKDELYLTAPVYVRAGITARQAWEGAQARIDDAIGAAEPHPALCQPPCPTSTGIAVTLQHQRQPNMPAWSSAPRNTSAPATSSRSC